MRRPGRWFAVAALVVVVTTGLQVSLATYSVSSGSMAPTLASGDRVWAERLTPRLGTVSRGDVVVFRDPGGWESAARAAQGLGAGSGGDVIVKRVVGVAGDRVVCCEAGALLLNGARLDEPYLPRGRPASTLAFDTRVPAGRLFVLGDDRDASLDSRMLTQTPAHGFVPLRDVVGVVMGP